MLAWGHGTPARRSLLAHGDPLRGREMAEGGTPPPRHHGEQSQRWVHHPWVPREWGQRWVHHPWEPWGAGLEVGPSPVGATGEESEVVMIQGVPDVPESTPPKCSRKPSSCGRAPPAPPQCARKTPRCAGETARCAWMPSRCAREPPDAIESPLNHSRQVMPPPPPPICQSTPPNVSGTTPRCAPVSPDVPEIHPYELKIPPNVLKHSQTCLGAHRCDTAPPQMC